MIPKTVLILAIYFANSVFGESVTLSQGVVKGFQAKSRSAKDYYGFKGIPFGKVEKRFNIPKPAGNWSGIFDATLSYKGCMDVGIFSAPNGVEDCLKLDVYTPKLTASEKMPVLVWIYGGGFFIGSTKDYGPEYFMDEDVVLVLINYRLGPLGFLNAGVASARGNQGLKDQVLGLQWIQENIENFGGNKDRVTIFGESAGAISVSLHVTSPMAKGLFHSAISQSGTAVQTFISANWGRGVDQAVKLAQDNNCPTSNKEYMVECLQRIDPYLLGKSSLKMDDFGLRPDTGLTMPSLETYSDGSNDPNVYLKENPLDLLKSGRFNKVPVIMGLIGWESYAAASSIIKSHDITHKLNSQWGRIGLRLMEVSNQAEDPAEAMVSIKKKFFPNGGITNESLWELEHVASERQWIHPFRVQAELLSHHVPVYIYNFTRMVPYKPLGMDIPMFSYLVEDGATTKKPSHGEDIAYVFKLEGMFSALLPNISARAEEVNVSKDMVKTWVNFAREGNLQTSPWSNWEPISGDNFYGSKYFEIGDTNDLKQVPAEWKELDEFWDGLKL
ncbi:esterase E4 [Folsomia candida]|uniref:Carboxylic ester hydrolase n=1 Tax=Folsomia candida TaxID=158441 RepID=A0A226F077_FOLCA|nr:esterase E4 [Folsomia candida]OXA62541.1 Esterase E4 [Folsomia candida]